MARGSCWLERLGNLVFFFSQLLPLFLSFLSSSLFFGFACTCLLVVPAPFTYNQLLTSKLLLYLPSCSRASASPIALFIQQITCSAFATGQT